MMRRILAALAALTLTLGLAACSGNWLLRDDESASPTPTASADPEPTPSATPDDSPTPLPGACNDLVINQPGNYELGDCGTVTLEGSGIVIEAASIDDLVIRGDRVEVTVTGSVASLEISGQSSEIDAGSMDAVRINGDRNEVRARGDIGPIAVSGSSNSVTSATAIGPVTESGQGNEIAVVP